MLGKLVLKSVAVSEAMFAIYAAIVIKLYFENVIKVMSVGEK